MADLTRHFHPVLRASQLRTKPVRIELDGTAYVLWRDATGAPRALRDRCPHRHAPLSLGRVRDDGRLACGYHGWHFDGDGTGASPAVPELRCSMAAFQLVEELGWLWLAARDVPASALPALARDGFRFVGSYALRAAAPLHVVVDNFSENEHTPYVHGRLGWREADAPRVTIDVKCHADRTEVTYVAPQRPSALLPLVLVKPGDVLENHWVTRFSPIHSIYELSWRAPNGERRPYELRVGIVFVPQSERSTHIVSFLFTRLAGRHVFPRRARDAAALAMGWKEVWDDARWVRHVADTQRGFEGMKLTRFDKPLAHNRKLADQIYYGANSSYGVRVAT